MSREKQLRVLILGFAAAAGWICRAPSQQQVTAGTGMTYRLVLGLRDKTGRKWDGRVEAPAGRVVRLEGWRFGEQDQVRGDEWTCATRPRAFNPAIAEPPDQTPMPVG